MATSQTVSVAVRGCNCCCECDWCWCWCWRWCRRCVAATSTSRGRVHHFGVLFCGFHCFLLLHLNSWAELDEMMGNYLREVCCSKAATTATTTATKYVLQHWAAFAGNAILWLCCACAPASAPSPSTPQHTRTERHTHRQTHTERHTPAATESEAATHTREEAATHEFAVSEREKMKRDCGWTGASRPGGDQCEQLQPQPGSASAVSADRSAAANHCLKANLGNGA